MSASAAERVRRELEVRRRCALDVLRDVRRRHPALFERTTAWFSDGTFMGLPLAELLRDLAAEDSDERHTAVPGQTITINWSHYRAGDEAIGDFLAAGMSPQLLEGLRSK